MNILFLTQVLPYPCVGGAKIRAYYVLRYLAQAHQVTLVSFVREDDRPEYCAHLLQFCAAVHTIPLQRSLLQNGWAMAESYLTGKPAVICRDRVPAMHRLLKEIIKAKNFDLIHADQTSMAEYGLSAAHAAKTQHPFLVLDQHNAFHLLLQRQAHYEPGLLGVIYRREARLFHRYEANLCRLYDRLLTVTEEDKAALLGLFFDAEREEITAKILTVPICVDVTDPPIAAGNDQDGHILHLGTMFWPPNVEAVLWFAEHVFPIILKRLPTACFTIAGKNPPPAVQALAAPGSPVAGHVEITGFVPDPEPLIRRSRVFIVPVLAGGGMRVKILDAWRWGIPIVSTSIGAEGIDTGDNGTNLLIADEPQDFAQAVLKVLTDDSLNNLLRTNGRRWVEARYDWRQVYSSLDVIYPRQNPILSTLAMEGSSWN